MVAVGRHFRDADLVGKLAVLAVPGLIRIAVFLNYTAVGTEEITHIEIGGTGQSKIAGAVFKSRLEAPAVEREGNVADLNGVAAGLEIQRQTGIERHGLRDGMDAAVGTDKLPAHGIRALRMGDEPGSPADRQGFAGGIFRDQDLRQSRILGGDRRRCRRWDRRRCDRGLGGRSGLHRDPGHGRDGTLTVGKLLLGKAVILGLRNRLAVLVGAGDGGTAVHTDIVHTLCPKLIHRNTLRGEAQRAPGVQIAGRALPGDGLKDIVVGIVSFVVIGDKAVLDEIGPVLTAVDHAAAGSDRGKVRVYFPDLAGRIEPGPLKIGGDDLKPPVVIQVRDGIEPGGRAGIADSPVVIVVQNEFSLNFLRDRGCPE